MEDFWPLTVFAYLLFYFTYLCCMWSPLQTFAWIFIFSFFLSPLLYSPKLLAKIYKMPLKPIFLSGRLVNLPRRAQEQSASSEDGIECILSDFDDDTGKCFESSKCRTNQLLPLHVLLQICQLLKAKKRENFIVYCFLVVYTHPPWKFRSCHLPYVKDTVHI